MARVDDLSQVYAIARQNPLYDGVSPSDFVKMAGCMNARTRRYGKGQVVLLSGSHLSQIGLVLSGSVKIIKEDEEGNASILSTLSAPELFGEVFICADLLASPVTVEVMEPARFCS
ncbi:MAG: cyclic nucleotide-binding domain-containing protein [Coriobacteriia bacterium]|nr:cyclic nucleotide-binding domain-containing protein [Coriobacteriia bacterium]